MQKMYDTYNLQTKTTILNKYLLILSQYAMIVKMLYLVNKMKYVWYYNVNFEIVK